MTHEFGEDGGLPDGPSTADASSASAAEQTEGVDTDLVDFQLAYPAVVLDMRYATKNNFIGEAMYSEARCKVRRPLVPALSSADRCLHSKDRRLVMWDCYRPFHIQEKFWKAHPVARYVARPLRAKGKPSKGSKHNRGAAVDVSVARADGAQVEVPTEFDDFGPMAHPGAAGVSDEAAKNAQYLRECMLANGFQASKSEWWHFDFRGWRDFPLSDEAL